MAKTLMQKMFHKPEHKTIILRAPKELKAHLGHFDSSIKGKYDFAMSFYLKMAEVEKEVPKLKKAMQENGLLWMAYPKAKKLDSDINRDVLWKAMKPQGLEGIAMVSLNDTWSAMRFKGREK